MIWIKSSFQLLSPSEPSSINQVFPGVTTKHSRQKPFHFTTDRRMQAKSLLSDLTRPSARISFTLQLAQVLILIVLLIVVP